MKKYINRKLRLTVLWITGRDLLNPKKKRGKEEGETYIHTSIEIPANKWELTFTKDAYMKIYNPTAPNVLNRLIQFLILGFRWKMLEIK